MNSPRKKHFSIVNNKLTIPISHGFEYIPIENIVHCKADASYTKLYLKDGVKVFSSKNISEYEKMLAAHNFFRVHKSHLVNLAHIAKYIKEEGLFVIMTDGSKIQISRRKNAELLHRLNEPDNGNP